MQANKAKLIVAILAVVVIIAVPSLVLSSHKSKIYVDANAKNTQDGSIDHPYKTIGQAMKAVKGKAEIHVAKGLYKENVKMKDKVSIFGASEDSVIIEAKDRDEAVVTMEDETVLNKVTVKNGTYGVKVDDDAKASIIKCVIKNNKKDGIYIKADGIKKSKMVSISKNEIKNNNAAGIYSGKRRLSISENEITDNDGDGIDIEKGASAWIADNKISSNDKSGMKLRVDGSDIWTKSNSIRKNNREGIEISFNGAVGRIDIAKSKIIDNDRYGIARVQKFAGINNSVWNKYVTFNNKNTIESNKSGSVSAVISAK
ncbi:MAG: hypothetical protein UT50_C0027G0010 [Candidatus Moranbacteria bacterium GW2011_GWA2_39_41]|nr:MAG: hypothetical protein UT50_C0027G0010 [Candidatus Moranbacteria bacterium GW2011_GWA2_39_41]